MTKFCKDCKWCREPGEFARCEAPQNIIEVQSKGNDFLVNGPRQSKKQYKWNFCSTHRKHGFLGSFMMKTCGQRGRWFVKAPDQNYKPVEDPREYLKVVSLNKHP